MEVARALLRHHSSTQQVSRRALSARESIWPQNNSWKLQPGMRGGCNGNGGGTKNQNPSRLLGPSAQRAATAPSRALGAHSRCRTRAVAFEIRTVKSLDPEEELQERGSGDAQLCSESPLESEPL